MVSILSQPQCVNLDVRASDDSDFLNRLSGVRRVSFMKFNPSGAEIRIFWASLCNTKASESLDPYITKPSATMLFTVQDERVLVFYQKGFQLPTPSQVLSNDRKCKDIFMYPKKTKGHCDVSITFVSTEP